MDPVYDTEMYTDLEKRFLDGRKLTFQESRLRFRNAVQNAYKTATDTDPKLLQVKKVFSIGSTC